MRLKETQSFYQPATFLTYSKDGGVAIHDIKPKEQPPEVIDFTTYHKYVGEKPHSVGIKPPTKAAELFIKTKEFGLVSSYLSPHFYQNSPELDTTIEMPLPQNLSDLCYQIRGLGGYALIVGGNVRDALISAFQDEQRILSKDVDLEVYGLCFTDLYRFLATTFGEKNLNMVGKAFGVIKLNLPGLDEPVDISIPRTDSKVGNGHKGFVINGDPSMNIAQAGQRRDLKINSISYDPLTETIFDPFGAEFDFKNRQISITDPEKFVEDPLRVFRLMQFIARFEMAPTPETIEICKRLVNSGELDDLAADRITEELKKMLLKGKRASLGLQFARQVGIVEKYWPELFALIDKPQNPAWHPEGDVWSHTLQTVDAAIEIAQREGLNKEEKLVLVLTLLCHDSGKATKTILESGIYKSPGHEIAGVEPAKTLLEKFKFTKEIVEQVLVLVPEHMQPKQIWMNQFPSDDQKPIDTKKAQKRLASRLGKGNATMYMLALVAEADQRGRNGESDLPLSRNQVDQLDEWQNWFLELAEELNITQKPPEPLIQGADLMSELNLKNGGKGIGVILKMIFLDQLDGIVTSVQEAIKKAKQYFQTWIEKFQIDITAKKIMYHPSWGKFEQVEDPRLLLA